MESDRRSFMLSQDESDLKLDFEIDKYKFRFVDICNLNTDDEIAYIQETNDFDAVKQMFGSVIACGFYFASLFYDRIAYDSIKEKINMCKKDPNYQHLTWFCTDQNGNFVGEFGTRTFYAKLDIPSSFEISGFITKKYRHQGIVSKIFPLFIPKIRRILNNMFEKNIGLLISTIPSNQIVKNIALKNKFEYITQYTELMDYGLFTMDTAFDVYYLK